MLKTETFDPTKTPRNIADIFMDCIDHYDMNATSFANRCGFRTNEKVHHITHSRNKPSYETLQAVVGGFPELNMDRFIRGTGPILMKDVCLENLQLTAVAPNSINAFGGNDSNCKEMIEMKDKLIDSLEKQVAFLQKMLEK
jgi:hypothetical protein